VLEDRDDLAKLPGPDELGAWLASCPGPVAWVECGRIVEALVADGGLRATRRRHRAWGMRLASFTFGDAIEERPRVAAARRLADLPIDSLSDRVSPVAAPLDFRGAARDLPVVLPPPAAATLVRALVHALRAPGRSGRAPLGPGLRVSEDPLHPEALTGGRFDDAGFPTRKRLLFQENSRSERGRGPYVRASYRDPPRPTFGTLVVEDGKPEAPEEVLGVEHLRIHPVDAGHWLVELGSVVERGGRPVRPVTLAFARVRPAELALRVLDRLGEARPCANGVITPALLLDGGFVE
jgi:hypothetical protein